MSQEAPTSRLMTAMLVTLLFFFAAGPVGCAPSLGQIRESGTSGDYEKLFEYLEDQRSWIREEAAQSLSRIPSPEVARKLEAVLLDGSERSYVRAAAAQTLGKIQDLQSLDLLRSLISSPGLPAELKISLLNAVCSYPASQITLEVIKPLTGDEDWLVSAVAESKVRMGCGR